MASLADNSQQPVCQNCTTSTTPLWRRDELGGVLCNACGLFLKLHGRPRPISLKTNVIKSRNRVKAAIPGQRRRPLNYEAAALSQQAQNAAAVAAAGGGISDTTTPSSILHHAAILNNSSNNANNSHLSGTLPPDEPISRTGTPGLKASSIAPQHLFDAASLEPNGANGVTPSTSSSNATAAATVAAFTSLRLPSPSPAHSLANTPLDPPPPYDTLLATSNALKTRVSELEVINDLFRGRVSELEAAEQEARRAESTARHAEVSAQNELEQLKAREDVLRKRLDELEGAGAAAATAAAATAAAAAAAAAAITTTTSSSSSISASITATNNTPPPGIANGSLSESGKDVDMIDRSIHSAVDETDETDVHGVINANSPTYTSAPFLDGAATDACTEDAPSPVDESTAVATAGNADNATSASVKVLDASDERPSKRVCLDGVERGRDGNDNNSNNNNNIDKGVRASTPLSSGSQRSLREDDATAGHADTDVSL